MTTSQAAAPTFTVITPAYNVAEYIGVAIDSVLAQTDGRFEYLIVDDGSTDDTVAIIKSYDDPRIRFIQGQHGGSAVARNLGLKEAKGEYIAFLDGDDRWNPDFLRKQLAFLASLSPEVGAVFCRARVMTANGQVMFARWQKAGAVDFDEMLVKNCPPRNGSSLLIRKSCFDEAGDFRESGSGVDFDMWLRMQLESSTPLFWSNPAYLIDLRVRPGAISSNLDRRFSTMNEILETYVPKLQHTPAGLAYIRPAILAFRSGYDDQAEKWMEKVKTAPTREILKDQFGTRVLAWDKAGRSQRNAMRSVIGSAKRTLPVVAGKAIGVVGKFRNR